VNNHLRFILLIITLSTSLLKAQTNLVPNPSFEEYSDCPVTTGQLDNAMGWLSPTNGSPDYYNICSTQPLVQIPVNQFGEQLAFSGQAYVGIGLYGSIYLNNREYLQSQLIEELVQGNYYCVSFYLSLAGRRTFAFTDDIGVFLSDFQPMNYDGGFPPLPLQNITPQIEANMLLNDTIYWIKISGLYKAVGGEKYLTIGNFKTDNETTLLPTDYPPGDFIYVYIDDVSVTEIAEPTIKGGTYVCNGDSVTLTADGDISEYTWYEQNSPNTILGNTPTLNVSPYQTTTYTLKAKVCGTEIEKNVTVNVCNNGQPSANIYPNPTTDVLNIQLQNVNLDNTVASLYNALGQIVLKENITNYTHTFNTQSLANGLYTLDITTNNKSISKHKVVVLH
jgi:hypothetical protein